MIYIVRERRINKIFSQVQFYKLDTWIGALTGPYNQENCECGDDVVVGGSSWGRFTATAGDPELRAKEIKILNGKITLIVGRRNISDLKRELDENGCLEEK